MNPNVYKMIERSLDTSNIFPKLSWSGSEKSVSRDNISCNLIDLLIFFFVAAFTLLQPFVYFAKSIFSSSFSTASFMMKQHSSCANSKDSSVQNNHASWHIMDPYDDRQDLVSSAHNDSSDVSQLLYPSTVVPNIQCPCFTIHLANECAVSFKHERNP